MLGRINIVSRSLIWRITCRDQQAAAYKGSRKINRPATHPIHFVADSPDKIIAALRFANAVPPQTLLRTDKEELCQIDTIPPTIEKTERSRRETPCCTYRYRLWSFAGCVLFRDAPCLFTMIHHFPRAASGIRHQHESGSDAAHPGIVPIFCAGMPCKLARKQCHFPAYCPILSA